MKQKRFFRAFISVLLLAAITVSLSVTAFADDKFSFELKMKDTDVKDVIIVSEKSGEYSVKAHAEELFTKYTGGKVAYYVAYDRYLKGEDYSHTEDKAAGLVIFGITGPTTIQIPNDIDVTSGLDINGTLLCIDIPDGTELSVSYTGAKGEKGVKCVAEGGVASFTIPAADVKGLESGKEFVITVKFAVDGKNYTETMKCPTVDGAAKIPVLIIPNGNGGNSEGGNEKGDSFPAGFHGFAFDIGGLRIGAVVDEDSLFDDVDLLLEKGSWDPTFTIGNDDIYMFQIKGSDIYNFVNAVRGR